MKYIYSLLFAVLFLTSCDTYGDSDQDFSPIYPLSGQYYVTVCDSDGVALNKAYLYLYNTVNNTADTLWVRLGSNSVNWGVLGKIPCNVKALTFNGDGPNLAFPIKVPKDSTYSDSIIVYKEFTIGLGEVLLDAATTPTKGKSDSIYVDFEVKGVKYSASGFRRTGWSDDQK